MSRGTTKPGRAHTGSRWLLFFYRVPSRPVSLRMKIWRRLAKEGAIPLKGAVYILPASDERYEFFQWFVAEVEAMGGEAAFVSVAEIASMKDSEIVSLFAARRTEEYRSLEKELEVLETAASSMAKGSRPRDLKTMENRFLSLAKSHAEMRARDFFGSDAGMAMKRRLDLLKTVFSREKTADAGRSVRLTQRREIRDYRNKIWVTRKRPFVDRIATAWLIRRFVDPGANFEFHDEKDLDAARQMPGRITFDTPGGDFTHAGDLCTFEVMMRTFGLRTRAVRKIAEIVHELDVNDDRYRSSEAGGLREILSGLRKSVTDDFGLLEKGMEVFEMLYRSKEV